MVSIVAMPDSGKNHQCIPRNDGCVVRLWRLAERDGLFLKLLLQSSFLKVKKPGKDITLVKADITNTGTNRVMDLQPRSEKDQHQFLCHSSKKSLSSI
jgi:hypothetical protein